MKTRADQYRIETKRRAVAKRITEAAASLEILSRMWDEKTLDTLILAFGIGHVELDEEP